MHNNIGVSIKFSVETSNFQRFEAPACDPKIKRTENRFRRSVINYSGTTIAVQTTLYAITAHRWTSELRCVS